MATAVILVLVAVGLTLAEVFFPSLGAFGLGAVVCLVVADMIAFDHSFVAGWIFIAVEVVIVPLTIWGAFRVLPHTKIGSRMVLSGPTREPVPGTPALGHLVGRQAEALTDLRPAGTVRLDGERISVVSLGGLIERGRAVVVVAVEGSEVRVRAVETDN